ncbi:MAG: hypothetical protein GY699_06030 [Desulfobacteraceae bacterium]|nr:hypothetical protein [Desulfobacteraceae bacterium]
MNSIKILKGAFNLFFIFFGIVWTFYGYLEFSGFADGGQPPEEDIYIIITGFLFFISGSFGFYNLIKKYKNKSTVYTYLLISTIFAIYVTVGMILEIGFLKMIKSYRQTILTLVISGFFFSFPIVTYFIYKRR